MGIDELCYHDFSLIDRARRTVRGSADDIGWLQCAPGLPPVEDGTERFLEILDNIKYVPYCLIFPKSSSYCCFINSVLPYFDRHGVHKLPNSLVYLLIPGKVTDYGHGPP